MNEKSNNPWVERFHPLLDAAEVRHLATVRPTPLIGLRALPKESACSQLHQALGAAFYPTSQGVTLLQRWLGIAYAHSQANYSGHTDYYGRLHDEDVEFRRGTLPMCLTGLAGIGKTELINAVARIMPPAMRIATKDEMSVRLESCRILKMEVSTNPNDLLRKFCGGTGSGDKLKRSCRRFAFRNGIAFVIADEFQFTALSSEASAQMTKMLLSLDTLGLPLVFAANYSMLHTLNKRNHQERQRLTTDITEFIPDSPDSEDWKETLALLQGVAPETFVFDPVEDVSTIHALCAGIKRALARLLEIAYSSVHDRGFVGMDELLKAYRSRDYASYREDLAALQQMTTEVRRKRKDLWSPFRPVDEIAEMEQRNFDYRQAQVAKASTLAAMTKEERKEAARATRQNPTNAEGTRRRGTKKTSPTAEELTQNMILFRDNLKNM